MKCRDALKQLPLLCDGSLEPEVGSEVTRHLFGCPGCRAGYDALAELREGLRALPRLTPPDYLRDLVRIRLASARKTSWPAGLRFDLERLLSRIRTTEARWLWTRALGSACALVCFFFIYATMNQLYVQAQLNPSTRSGISHAASYQVVLNVLKNLGMVSLEAQRKPIGATDPKINELYLLDFGQNALGTGRDDTFSVVTSVDRNGAAKIEGVIEYPADASLLADFNVMIQRARCRPARLNGRPVDSILVLTFSKISVYD